MSKLLEVLSGARLSNELTHRFEQWGIPDSWAKNWGTNLSFSPLGAPVTNYYADRERGGSTTHARQFAQNDALRTLISAAAVYGGVEAGGAMGGGGAAGSGGGSAGAGGTFGTSEGIGGTVGGGSAAPAGGMNYGSLLKSFGGNMQQGGQQQRQAPSDNGIQALLAALMAQQYQPKQQSLYGP